MLYIVVTIIVILAMGKAFLPSAHPPKPEVSKPFLLGSSCLNVTAMGSFAPDFSTDFFPNK